MFLWLKPKCSWQPYVLVWTQLFQLFRSKKLFRPGALLQLAHAAYMPNTPPSHPLTYTHSYVNTQRQAVPLWVSAAERKLLNNWQWWAARSQSETNLKRSARDVNSTHINYHWLLVCLHHSTDWQLDSTLATVGFGDFGFGFAVITMSNTSSHKCQVATQL